jgi:nucleotide-binding universal stress UspA family protein
MIVRRPLDLESTSEGRDRKVVVGVDGSNGAALALEWALDEASRLQAGLKIVSARTPPAHGSLMLADQITLEHAARVSARVRPEVEVTTVLSAQPPSWTLVKASERAELLVVGSRGLGGFQSMLLGSVSQHCATHAKCSTLIVREPR